MQWMILCLKITLVCGFVSLVGWVVLYTFLASWWRNAVGRTLVAKTALVAGLFVAPILSIFFRLNPYIAGWVDVALVGLVTPVMLWRSAVWWQLHKTGRLPRDGDGETPGGKHEL